MTTTGVDRPRFLLGLIGSGIQASRTPALHEAEGDAQGFRVLYQTIDLDPLDLGTEISIAADRTSVAYRRLLKDMGLSLTFTG